MCGITGIFSLDGNIDPLKLQKMTAIVKHRGPDDEGFYLFNDKSEINCHGDDSVKEIKHKYPKHISDIKDFNAILAFGHRRLSIIDISPAGHQPMKIDQFVLVFNGEIYNYLEIRDNLIEQGVNFQTDSDTEVLIKAYSFWGEDCVTYFDGMWSFAIWDTSNKKLFCSRDRFGEKPFYYYFNDGVFVFSSEIKQILEYGVPFSVNEKILHRFLKFSLVNVDKETFFENINVLPHAHNLTLSTNENKISVNIQRYYSLEKKNKYKASFQENTKILGEKLEESIKRRLRSDVEVGSCLSGGLDSSSIVTLVSKQLINKNLDTQDFKTFTSVYKDFPLFDESYFSDKITFESKTTNYKINPTPKDLIEEIDKIIFHQEEPFANFSIFASWSVMKLAKSMNTKVLLDGQGGDETFLGYSRHFTYYLMGNILKFNWKSFFHNSKALAKNNSFNYLRLLKETFYFNFSFIRKSRMKTKSKKYLNNYFRNKFRKDTKIIDEINGIKTFKNRPKLDFEYLIISLLRYEDKNAMAHSIETRLPFLNHELVEYCYSIEPKQRLNNGWSKSILREYMKDKMNMEVTERKRKLGFSTPDSSWYYDLKPLIVDLIEDNPRSIKYFDYEKIRLHLKEDINKELIIKFYIVEKWMRVFERWK